MTLALSGIHHVTAIAGAPQDNIDFYTGVLGLRLIKITVNYDDPATYHIYYGDETGSPGSILSFFAWPEGYPGQQGPGQTTAIAYSVPPGSVDWWRDRLKRHRVPCEAPTTRLGQAVLGFYDRDGLALELVEDPGAAERPAWRRGAAPAEVATRGFHSVTLATRDAAPTLEMLTGSLGLEVVCEEGNRTRLTMGGEGPARLVDVVALTGAPRATSGLGTVHHVGMRTATIAQQKEWRDRLLGQKRQVSAVTDRHYFQSVYFKDPNGILYEIATDLPGFLIDEPLERLGDELRIPNWLEGSREEIVRGLLPLTIPLAIGPQG